MELSRRDVPTMTSPAGLTGRVVCPGDADYRAASTGWDELFTHHPLAIVYARETQDVINALTWARRNDVALRVRSGRHCLEGWSNVDNGIVIDVSGLKAARVDAAACTATVGAGLTQMEAVTTLGKEGLAAPTGTEAPSDWSAPPSAVDWACSPAASGWLATT